jgi:hypothetical protein
MAAMATAAPASAPTIGAVPAEADPVGTGAAVPGAGAGSVDGLGEAVDDGVTAPAASSG